MIFIYRNDFGDMVYPCHYNGVAPLVVMMMMMMMKAVVLKNGRPQRAGSPAVLMLAAAINLDHSIQLSIKPLVCWLDMCKLINVCDFSSQ